MDCIAKKMLFNKNKTYQPPIGRASAVLLLSPTIYSWYFKVFFTADHYLHSG